MKCYLKYDKETLKKTIKKCLLYSLPLAPSIAGSWIAGLSDRLVIAKFVNLDAVGLYSLGFNIAMLLYIVQDAITQVTGPITMSGMVGDKERVKSKIIDFSLVMWAFMLFANFLLFQFSKEIVEIVTYFSDNSNR